MRKTLTQRFAEKVQLPDSPEGCWVWKASVAGKGYGKMWTGVANAFAHRFSYEMFVGPIPSGLDLDHLCRNRACVNPLHLEAVTSRVNRIRVTSLKTHCPRGHPYAGENLRTDSTGGRLCRSCQRARQRAPEYRARETARRLNRNKSRA